MLPDVNVILEDNRNQLQEISLKANQQEGRTRLPELSSSMGDLERPLDQFEVELEVFQGPFDLLLQLISRKKLDITEITLAEVTDEFITYMGVFPDLSRTTEFLVVAATLLDLKAAHLLPSLPDEGDLEMADLEARDLLFSRLLQYKAFKMAATAIGERLDELSRSFPRDVPLEPHFAAILPELKWNTTPEELARLAADVFSHIPPTVQVTHLHDPDVPIWEQIEWVSAFLRETKKTTFQTLVEDAGTRAVIVSRFLALLELYRRQRIEFGQDEALGTLEVIWTGSDEDGIFDVDEYSGDASTALGYIGADVASANLDSQESRPL